MATGIDSRNDASADARLAAPPQTVIDQVHQLRTTAKAPDAGASGSPPVVPQEVSFGGTDDFQRLYGKDALLGAAAPARAEVHNGQPPRSGDQPSSPPKPGDNRQPVTDRTNPGAEPTNAQARESLLKAAREQFKNDPKALEAFQHDMDTFEARMSKSPGEIGKTYGQIERMLTGHSMALPDKDRKSIAAEVMHQASTPHINQGDSEDCLAASLETRMYTRAPAQAAKLMADMVLTGSYETTNHRMIRLDADTMNGYQSKLSLMGQEARTHASKIMQATLRNIDLDMVNQEQGTNLRYEIHADSKMLQALNFNGNGEHVVDYSKNPPQDVTKEHNGMRNGYDEDVYQAVTGTNDGGFSLNAYTQVNKEEFKKALDDMARQGKFPATIGVNLLQEPFQTQGGGRDSALGAMVMMNGLAMHAITINSYDPKTGQIEYTNHLSGSQTGKIDRDDLFKAMHQPDLDGFTDGFAQNVRDQAKADPSLKDKVANNMFQMLSMLEPEGRQHVLDVLSQQLGIDLKSKMTREERHRLGLKEDDIFDFLRRQFQ